MNSARPRLPWLLVGLLAFSVSTSAQILERFSPPSGASLLPARPTVAWSFGTGNLLSNPGFEDGTNGWAVTGGTLATMIFPNSAADGTKALRILRGSVSREVTLPAAPQATTLSFALRGLPQLPDSGWLEVADLEGTVPTRRFPMTEFVASGSWSVMTVDLSAFGGRPVRLTWSNPRADTVNQSWLIDDVRLVPVPVGAEFEVWWKRDRVTPFESLGRSPNPSRLLPELATFLRYEWRVDVHYQGSVIPGAVQSFTTAHASGAETIQEIIVPELACPGQPFPTRLRVTDERGFPAPNTPVTFSLNAQGTTANPAGVLITEVDSGSVDGVELQNLSAQPIDVSGWQVDLLRTTDTTASMKIKVPAGSTLAPGGRFTILENRPVTSAWPTLGTPGPLDWDDRLGSTLTAGVILRDDSGEVRDAVFIEVQPRIINGETLPRQSGTLPQTDWRTLPLALKGVAGETYQRFGNQDHNDASDWRMAAGSLDQTNVELSSLFLPGFGTYPAQPSGLTNVRTDLQGWVQFPFTISSAADPVQVQARLRTLNLLAIKTAESPVFRVDPTTCLSLSLPAEVREGAGTIPHGLRVTLAQPTPTNLTLRLFHDQSRLVLPDTLEIPAGSAEFVTDLVVANDLLLTGPVTAQLQVTAPGYSPASRSMVLIDDEIAALRWEGEATVREGESASATLVLDRPADAPLRIPLTSSNPSRLAVAPFVNIPAGTNRGTASWSALNNPLLGDSITVEVEASFADWAPARLPVSILDDETNTIRVDVSFNQPSEGQTVDLAISLGGASPTNLPMTITVSRPDRVQTPENPEFPALGSGIITSLQLLDDSRVTGREEVVVEVSLPGYQTGRATLVLIDNDPGRLSLALPVGPFAIGQEVGARLRAQTIDGDPLPNADLSGSVTTLRSTNPLQFGQAAPIALDDYHWVSVVAKEASPSARLHVEALGLSVESEPFPIWPTITAQGVRWASYDSVRDRIIVLDLAGALFAIDVSTGTRTDFTPTIPPADVCRVSLDGQLLFVVHSDLRRLARFSLATLTLEADWDVGTADGTPLRVDSLASVPGQPQTVVVARRYQRPESGPEPERLFDLAVFDGTQLRPNRVQFEVGNFLGSTVVVAGDGQWVTLVERTRLQSYRLGPLGVTVDPNLRQSFLGLDFGPESGTAVQVHNTILTLRSQQLDPLLAGEFGPGLQGFEDHLFGFDPSGDWVGWINPGRPLLRLLAPQSLHVLAEMPLSESLEARTFHLEPAGPRRWLWINRNRLRLIFYPPPTLTEHRDLAVTAEVTARDLTLSQADMVFRVTHSGNQPAENVTLSLGLPSGWDQLDRPAYEWVSGAPEYPLDRTPLGGNRYLLGTLALGDVREVRLRISSFPTYALGELWVSALVGSPAPDPEPANNRAELRVSGLLAPIPELRLKAFQGPGAEIVFEFTPGFDHQYLLEHSTSLNGPWADAYGQTIIGRGLPVSITPSQPVAGPNTYWRLRQIFPE